MPIPVILIDRKVSVDDDSLYASWVGSDFVCEGQDAGYWLEDYMKKQGREDDEVNIVVLKGTKGASATIGRTRDSMKWQRCSAIGTFCSR